MGMDAFDPATQRLVQQASSGDAGAVEGLLERYLPGLHAFVRLRAGPVLRGKESSSDLVQSVCRELLQNLDRVRYGGEQGFKRWLYTAALRKIVNRAEYWQAERRNVGREVAMEQDSALEVQLLSCYRSFCTPSRVAAEREQVELIERAFQKLSDEHREVITSAYLMGLSRKEIGEQMGRSEGAVRKLLARALAHLSELIT